jgi:hypothetical protein
MVPKRCHHRSFLIVCKGAGCISYLELLAECPKNAAVDLQTQLAPKQYSSTVRGSSLFADSFKGHLEGFLSLLAQVTGTHGHLEEMVGVRWAEWGGSCHTLAKMLEVNLQHLWMVSYAANRGQVQMMKLGLSGRAHLQQPQAWPLSDTHESTHC